MGDESSPGPGEAAVFLTAEPDADIDDWRVLAADTLDAVVEIDERLEIGGAPAWRLVLRHDSGKVPTREMVVVIPARGLVLLAQPVVLRGDDNGPSVFDRHLAEFQAIIDSIRFTRPTT